MHRRDTVSVNTPKQEIIILLKPFKILRLQSVFEPQLPVHDLQPRAWLLLKETATKFISVLLVL